MISTSATSSDLVAFDDGYTSVAIPGSEAVFPVNLDGENILLGDDLDTLYVLYQGAGGCSSSILRYSLSAGSWLPSIPLRWKAEFIRLLRGDDPASGTDDVIAVGYNTGATFNHGNFWAYLSFVNIGAGELAEDELLDVGFFSTEYPMLDLIATDNAAIAKMKSSEGPDVLVFAPGAAGSRTDDVVTDLASSVFQWNSTAQSLVGYSNTRLYDMGILAESATTGSFDTYQELALTSPGTPEGDEAWVSVDGSLMLASNGWLYSYDPVNQIYNSDLPVDSLSAEILDAAWSTFAPAGGNHYLYTASDFNGDMLVQRWEDSSGNFSAGVDFSALIAGTPKAVLIAPGATEDTVYAVSVNEGALAITELAADLGDDGDLGSGVGGEPAGGGGATGGGGGNTPANVDDNALIMFTDHDDTRGGSFGGFILLLLGLAGAMRRRA